MCQPDGQFAGTFGEGGYLVSTPPKFWARSVMAASSSPTMKQLTSACWPTAITGATPTARSSPPDATRASTICMPAYSGCFLKNISMAGSRIAKRLCGFKDSRLSAIPQISVPKYNFRAGHKSVFQNYEIVAENRPACRTPSRKQDRHADPVEWQRNQRSLLVTNKTSTPKSDAFFKGCLMLPLNHVISEEEASRVCSVIEEFYNGQG